MKTNIPSNIHKQKGVAILTFSIILLIVLTLLGTSAVDLSGMELRQSRSLMEYNRAFQVAESGLQKYLATYKVINDPVTDLPSVTYNLSTFCLVASSAAASRPACLNENVKVDTGLKVGEGMAEIELKRSNLITEAVGHKYMYVVVQSTGYSKDKNNPKAFKVILNAGLKLPKY